MSAPPDAVAAETRRGLHRVVRWVLSLGMLALLVMFARRVDWGATWASMRAASLPLLIGATALNLLSLVVKGIRWWIFLRPVGSRSPWLAVRATAAGAGLNNVLVANGGDAARIVFVARSTGLPSATVLATLALERVFDVVGYVVLLAGAAAFLPLPPDLARYRLPAQVAVLVMVGGLTALALRRPPVGDPAPGIAQVIVPVSVVARTRAYWAKFGRDVAELSTGPRFVGAFLLSMLAWACQLGVFALTASAAGAALPPAGNLAALLAVNAGLLVRATPGNVGVFQLAYALAATRFGMTGETALAVSLLIQSLQILPTTLLGVALAPEFVMRRASVGTP